MRCRRGGADSGDEGVGDTGKGLVGEGLVAVACGIEAGGAVPRDAGGLVVGGRAELARPGFRAGRIIEADIGIRAARAGLPRQRAEGIASDGGSGGSGGEAQHGVPSDSAELAGPQGGAV